MNFFTLSSFLVAMFSYIMAFFIFKIAKNSTHKMWAYFNLAVGTWSLFVFLASLQSKPALAMFCWKFAYVSAAFITSLFYSFFYLYCNLKKTKTLFLVHFSSFIFIFITILTNHLIQDPLTFYQAFYYHKATLAFTYYVIWMICVMLLTFTELFQYIKTLTEPAKSNTFILFYAFLLGWTGGITTLLPPFGFTIYPIQITICFYLFFMSYAIFRYNVIDLIIVVKSSLVYSLLITFMTLIYLLSISALESFTRNIFSYKSASFSFLIIFAFGLLFIPLRNFIQNFIDRKFLKATPIELAQQNELLLKEVSEKERFKKVATLASGMAHEIKNPLTAIKTFTEYLEKHRNDADFYQKFSRIVGKEVDRIDDLVHQLLEFSKPFPVELKQCDMVKLVDDTLAFLDSQFLKNNITVHKVYDVSSPILVTMDPVQIRQVILNIFINAIEAMETKTKSHSEPKRSEGEESPVQPDSSPRPVDSVQNDNLPKKKSITVTITQIKNHVIFSTTDTGSGIAKEDLKHIFEPFFTKKDNGTGLGLSISYGIIEKHKGKIEVKSAVGVGTEFRIKLPVERKS